MELKLEGLEQGLDKGYEITARKSDLGNIIVRIENKTLKNEIELIAAKETDKLMNGLKHLSGYMAGVLGQIVVEEYTNIDPILWNGFILHISKRKNDVTATILAGAYSNYIPVRTIIRPTLEDALFLLNESVKEYVHDFDASEFCELTEKVTKPIYAYQKKERDKKRVLR